MTELFLKIINMSISASWLVFAVLLIRFVLKKSPKWINVLLWGIVALRLLCPFSVESIFSMIPSAETIPDEVLLGPSFDIETGIEPVDSQINDYLGDHYFEGVTVPTNNGASVMTAVTVVWIVGILILLIYTVISYLRLRRKVETAIFYHDNIFQSENVSSPFVFGIIKPRIYLSFKIDGQDMKHVIAHEQAHISRKDHLWKPVGFLLLTIHWLNPLMWLAYILLCRDIELACDERVIKELNNEQRADYTQALVSCSVDRRVIAACPLAFGEVRVKDRVKSVMNYKKPAFWIINISVFTCLAVAVCFLTDPLPDREFPMNGHNVSDIDVTEILDNIAEIENLDDSSLLCVNSVNFSDIWLLPDFDLRDNQTISFFYMEDQKMYGAQLRLYTYDNHFSVTQSGEWGEQSRVYKLQHYLEAIKYLPQEEIRKLSPDADGYMVNLVNYGEPNESESVITYSPNGVTDLDEWYIHLTILPMYGADGLYKGDGGGLLHLFYGYEDTVWTSDELTSDTPDKFFLTIGADDVTSIEIKTPNTSGGCTNADGSPFKKGERVWLECLDGETDLRGLRVSAFNENGEVVWSASIPDGAENSGFVRLRQDGWEITNIE